MTRNNTGFYIHIFEQIINTGDVIEVTAMI